MSGRPEGTPIIYCETLTPSLGSTSPTGETKHMVHRQGLYGFNIRLGGPQRKAQHLSVNASDKLIQLSLAFKWPSSQDLQTIYPRAMFSMCQVLGGGGSNIEGKEL